VKSHKQIWKTNSDKNRATEIYKSVKISPALFLQCWHHILIFWIQNPVLDLNLPIKVHLNILSERGTCEGKEDNRYMEKKFHKGTHMQACTHTHKYTPKKQSLLSITGLFWAWPKMQCWHRFHLPFLMCNWLNQIIRARSMRGKRGVCVCEREREFQGRQTLWLRDHRCRWGGSRQRQASAASALDHDQ
jgi:hypothetical protein